MRKIRVITHASALQRYYGQLTGADFENPLKLAEREADLWDHALPAEQMFTGPHFRAIMEGVHDARGSGKYLVDMQVLSPAYKLIPGSRKIVAYRHSLPATTKQQIHWGYVNGIGKAYRDQVQLSRCDLILVALADNYLRTIGLPLMGVYDTPTLYFVNVGSRAGGFGPEEDKRTLMFKTPERVAGRHPHHSLRSLAVKCFLKSLAAGDEGLWWRLTANEPDTVALAQDALEMSFS